MPSLESILTYDDLTPKQRVFMFNLIMEEAAKAVFTGAELTAYSSFVRPEFQKQRPRAEIFFTLGAGQLRWAPRAALPDALKNQKIESAYKGTLQFNCITEASMAIHSAYLTEVRVLMCQFQALVNDVSPMIYHKVQLCVPAGETPTIEPETGYYMTALHYNLDFSIQANAWALLNNA